MAAATPLATLVDKWINAWPDALTLWSPYAKLRPPLFCLDKADEKREGLTESFAMIRLNDLSVVLSAEQIHNLKLTDLPLEIMAHEIGHHVYCPADLADLGRMIARMRPALPSCESMTGMVANIYSDLLINDKLFREHNLKMDKIYKLMDIKTDDPFWNFYMRIYEILWSLPRGTLVSIELNEESEGDAILGNQVIRHYSREWLRGAGRFAALCLPYLLKMKETQPDKLFRAWMDTGSPGDAESIPSGLISIEEDEISGAVHPAMEQNGKAGTEGNRPGEAGQEGDSRGNYREPFELGEILKNMGISLTPQEIALRYYKERALPYLIPFPKKRIPSSTEPLPEGLEVWDIGSSFEKINWVESTIRSPVVIPGFTTLEQVYGETEGAEPEAEPVDLDLYVDCSGSMPNPVRNTSFLTLAGAVIALSALRTGSRVQATLWSGTREFLITDGFVRDERKILEILTGYFGGGTAFPIHVLRDTYSARDTARARKVHILVISDDGVTTMFDKDEKGNAGADIAAMALEKAGGGGTFVLNLWKDWEKDKKLVMSHKMGWDIHPIRQWEDLIEFSKKFTKKHYQKEVKG